MRGLLVISALLSLAACTVYQSDGREAIEKNTNSIVTASGFDSVQRVAFVCRQSAAEPSELKSPNELIEHAHQDKGYLAFNLTGVKETNLMVYRLQEETGSGLHEFCHLDTQDDFSEAKIQSAIFLGVQLLDLRPSQSF